jgi:hypothetical protein
MPLAMRVVDERVPRDPLWMKYLRDVWCKSERALETSRFRFEGLGREITAPAALSRSPAPSVTTTSQHVHLHDQQPSEASNTSLGQSCPSQYYLNLLHCAYNLCMKLVDL